MDQLFPKFVRIESLLTVHVNSLRANQLEKQSEEYWPLYVQYNNTSSEH